MDFIFAYSPIEFIPIILSFLILSIFTITALINSVFGPFLRNEKNELKSFPLVSVLIPARNEQKNITTVLDSILNQDYPNYEVILLDDNSDDDTYKNASGFLNTFKNFRLVKGDFLIDGWLGKPYACHQLSKYAKGEFLIFTDADNSYDKSAITKTINIMTRKKLSLFSVFPQQKTGSFWEKLIIPLIDMIIYSGLILYTTYILPYRQFAAANGQWIAFRRDDYFKIGGHESVKSHIVEDVALSRIFKSRGYKILTGAGTGAVYGKMYSNFKEIWHGLSKNLFGLTDFKTLPFFLILLSLNMVSVLPFFSIFNDKYFIISLILISINILWRSILSIGFKHNILISVIFHPFSIIILTVIGINSFIQSKFGKVQWKNREIRISK